MYDTDNSTKFEVGDRVVIIESPECPGTVLWVIPNDKANPTEYLHRIEWDDERARREHFPNGPILLSGEDLRRGNA
jgi:hypothetical protein